MIFFKGKVEKLKTKNPEKTASEIRKLMSLEWKNLTEEKK